LEWAQERKSVVLSDLEEIKIKIAESFSKETEFQKQIKAYGHGLIGRVNWNRDEKISDFFEGKKTRPGHIVANADYKREFWLDKIDKAISTSKICIIKSSSGQGKSAFLYRYAYEKWSEDNTYIMRLAETTEQIELIRNYLQFRASLRVPILLLIDDIGWGTRLWSSIIQECAALGIRVLVTIRNEDWYRFSQEEMTGYEVIEPELKLDEAKNIFYSFKNENKVDENVTSTEWAYEKIGKPELLIEYIYLITHGKMLEERLRNQIKEITRQGEDPSKIEILRRSSLANALGATVLKNKLLDDIESTEDKQLLLQSLKDEYIELDGEEIKGLHWVRSDHLNKILHEDYPDMAETALKVFDDIKPKYIPNFVSNALCEKSLTETIFLKGLNDKDLQIKEILAILNGIFEAGEKKFFKENENIFDDAYALIGSPGPEFLHLEFIEYGNGPSLEDLGDSAGDKGQNFYKLKKIADNAKIIPRGIDLCNNFLTQLNPKINSKSFEDHFNDLGILLDWFSLCKIEMDIWPDIKSNLIDSKNIFKKPINEFCSFTQGLYRYDEDSYCEWFLGNNDSIIDYLKFNLECIELIVDENILKIEFIIFDLKVEPVKQTRSRLQILNEAIPFCDRYQSKGELFIPFNLEIPIQNIPLNIPRENLLFETDVKKNMVLGKIITENYLPDSFHSFQKLWYILRRNALKFVMEFSRELIKLISKKQFDFTGIYKNEELINVLDNITKYEVDLPPQTQNNIKTDFKVASEWANSFRNFFNQITDYLVNKEVKMGKLSLLNFQNTLKYLKELKIAFNPIFDNYPTYFDFQNLDNNEIKKYELLHDLLDLWISNPTWLNNPKEKAPKNILRFLKAIKIKKRNLMLNRVKNALIPLENEGIAIILPNDIHLDPTLRYLSFAFSVDDYGIFDKAWKMIIGRLNHITDVADFFCVIPLFKWKIFLEGGYQISSNQISEIVKGEIKKNLWYLMPHKINKEFLVHLEEFEFQDTPLLKLTGVITILTDIQMIIGIIKKIGILNDSQNYSDNKLYKKYMFKLNDRLNELKEMALKIKNYLINEFPNEEEDLDYKLILDLIIKIENSSLNNISNELYISLEYLNKISYAILRLISKN